MHWLSVWLIRASHLGGWGPVWFILVFVAATVTLVPAFLLTLVAGALYGFWRGTALAFLAAVIGASVVFVLASPLARCRWLRWVDRDARVAAIRRAVAGDSGWMMFLLRLSPLVPYVLLNYGLALSGVRYRDFLVTSVGMLPAILLCVYYGKVVGDVAKLAAGVTPPHGPEYYALVVVGLVATVAATALIARAARRAMARQQDPLG